MSRPKVPVAIDGTRYDSLQEASVALGVNPKTLNQYHAADVKTYKGHVLDFSPDAPTPGIAEARASFERRVAAFGKPQLRLAKHPGECYRTPIHHLGGGLLPGLVVHRLGSYVGGRW